MSVQKCFSILSLCLLVVLSWCGVEPEMEEQAWIANPAATHCLEKGWTLNTVHKEDWDHTMCEFEDWISCEEWDYFRWECPVEDSQDSTVLTRRLSTFNGEPVDGNYELTIDAEWNLYVNLCNNIWGQISFEEWYIKVDEMYQEEMACDGESDILESAFEIDWASYEIAESWFDLLLIITTVNWDEFVWGNW